MDADMAAVRGELFLPCVAARRRFYTRIKDEAAFARRTTMDFVDKPDPELVARAQEALRVLRERLAHKLTPEYAAELQRQAALLRDSPDEDEIMAFIEAVSDYGDE
jgi:hypothetical protein